MVDFREFCINLRLQSITNLCLASILIFFQIVLLIKFPDDAFEKAGSGFWTGIVFAFTGLVTWRSVENYRYSKASLVLSCISVTCGIVLVSLYSASINRLQSCRIQQESEKSKHFCDSHVAHITLNVFMLLFGLLGIFINILLAYSTRLFLGS